MFNKKNFTFTIVLFIVVLLLIGYFFVFKNISFEQFKANRDMIKSIVFNEYYKCLVIIMLGYVLSAFGIPITPILTLIVGFLFGWKIGTMHALLYIIIGSTIVFLFSRYVIRDLIWDKYSVKIEKINSHIGTDATKYFTSIRLIPFLPICIMNYVGGLSKLSIEEFVLGTLISKLPYCLIYTFAGDNIMNVENISEVYSVKTIGVLVILAIIAIVPIIYRWLKRTSL